MEAFAMKDIDSGYNPKGLEHSELLRKRLQVHGHIVQWPTMERPVERGYSPEEVQRYCVHDRAWQEVRLFMKGKPTHEKLEILVAWWDKHYTHRINDGIYEVVYQCEVQVGNYLGALRRGGQLNDDNQIRKYI